MKRLLLALSLFAVLQPSQATKSKDIWTLVIQQGAKQYQPNKTIRLKRAAFDVRFTGAQNMGFAVVAANDCKALEDLKTSDQISRVIRPTNIAVEDSSADNVDILINSHSDMSTDNGVAHVWGDDKENNIHSFQKLTKLTGYQVVSTRKINKIGMQLDGGKIQTVLASKYSGAEICMLVTGLPPVGYMAHVDPKLIRITFE